MDRTTIQSQKDEATTFGATMDTEPTETLKAHWKRDVKFINNVTRAGYKKEGPDFLNLVEDRGFPALVAFSFQHRVYHPIHEARYGLPHARNIDETTFAEELSNVMDLSEVKKRARVTEAVDNVREHVRSGDLARTIDFSNDSGDSISSCGASDRSTTDRAPLGVIMRKQREAYEGLLQRELKALAFVLQRDLESLARTPEDQRHVTGSVQAKRKRDADVDTAAADNGLGGNDNNTIPVPKRRCITRCIKTSMTITAAAACTVAVAAGYQRGMLTDLVAAVPDVLGPVYAAAAPLASTMHTALWDGVSEVASRGGSVILSMPRPSAP